MLDNIKKSKNPFDSTLNDLKLFEQTNYCFNYIKDNNPTIDDKDISIHSKIASACFRQANEFLKSANKVTLTTSPLLYSYALNNYLKGSAYLLTFDKDILKGFKNHGFSVKDDKVLSSLCTSKINIGKNGAVMSLLKIFCNTSLDAQEISFSTLIRHLPEIEDIYFKTTQNPPYVAIRNKNEKNEFFMPGDNIDSDTETIFKNFGIVGQRMRKSQQYIFYLNMRGQQLHNGLYSSENIFYKDYLIFPESFSEGIKDINLIFYCYLLIMGYGMLVRYNAHKWEDFIDKKISNEATLVELSVIESVKHFIYQLHKKIFNYMYLEDDYNNLDVKKVIDESTADIMNNINDKIIEDARRYGNEALLPWHQNVR